MAQYSTDFSNGISNWETYIQNSSSFVSEIVTENDEQYYHIGDATDNDINIVRWNNIPYSEAKNVEVLMKVKWFNKPVGNIAIATRVAGVEGGEWAYMCGLDKVITQSSIDIKKIVEGDRSTISGRGYDFLSIDEWFWLRFRCNEDNIFAKVWPDDEEEPTDWNISEIDDDNGATGYVGLAMFHEFGGQAEAYIDYYAVGTEGDTAPIIDYYQTPSVTTQPPTDILINTATLNGTIDEIGRDANAKAYFEWGTDTDYGNTTNTIKNITNGQDISADISNLEPGITYHYRVVIENGLTTSYGEDMSFATDEPPVITILNSNYPDITFETIDPDGTVESVEILTKSSTQSEYYSRRNYTAEEAESEMTFAIYSHYFDEGVNEVKIIATDNEGATTEEILTYNTYDMFDIDYFPTDETNTGVIEIGATVNLPTHYDNFFMSVYQPAWQPTDRQYNMTVEIADNADYIDSVTYNSNNHNNGDTATIQHAIVNSGDYYIKINVVDSRGWEAEEIEYILTVIEIFYFLEEPQIERGAMQANSITVKSDTAEYTATTDPPPAPDELIETEISIEEGDEETCQAVAEKLIEKWGKEPLTITGLVNLTVTLRFKQKIRIVIPTNEIDDYFIVQKKTHYVTENTTEIIAGDIILNENELLARILSEME